MRRKAEEKIEMTPVPGIPAVKVVTGTGIINDFLISGIRCRQRSFLQRLFGRADRFLIRSAVDLPVSGAVHIDFMVIIAVKRLLRHQNISRESAASKIRIAALCIHIQG